LTTEESTPPTRLVRRVLSAALLAIVAAAAAYVIWFGNHRLHPGDEVYSVSLGTSLRAFAGQLASRGVITEPHTLVLWAHLKGGSRSLKAGDYRFHDGITARELLDQVFAGRGISYTVSFIEGWNFRQVRSALENAPKLAATLKGLSDSALMEKLGHPGVHPEGRFFPDTYHFNAGTTDVAILQLAYDRMTNFLDQAWARRDRGLPLKNPEQALILASIVEKETGLAQERPIIARVFLNRLEKGMRLQTDPTVIYGLGDAFDGNLRRRDLRTDTPYNTYTREGLPPTPIAMPGAAAILATLQPAKSDALYFVARGDGSHQFSDTLREHNNAVIRYQLGGKPKPFSSYEGKAKDAASSEKSTP
jgi:UPF0755 protein